MPPKPPGRQHRRPYARQQAIRCRIQQLYGGKWRQLLVPQEAGDAPVVTDEQTKDKDPDQALAAALRVSRSRGKLSKSWKRLQGHGLLPPGEATNALLTAKWASQPNAPLPSDHNGALRDCEDLWTPTLVDAAVANLKAGTAADAAGWTSEAIQMLHGNLPAAQLVSDPAQEIYGVSPFIPAMADSLHEFPYPIKEVASRRSTPYCCSKCMA